MKAVAIVFILVLNAQLASAASPTAGAKLTPAATPAPVAAIATGEQSKTAEQESTELVGVTVDRIIVDSDGVAEAARDLATGITDLSRAIEKMASSDAPLTAEERADVMAAIHSMDEASKAMDKLAGEMPLALNKLDQTMGTTMGQLQELMTSMAANLAAANHGLLLATESFPELATKFRALAEETSTAILDRSMIYLGGLLALILLVVGIAIYLAYIRLIVPLIAIMEVLKFAPAQLQEMAQQMNTTSENLLKLETGNR